MLTSAWKDLDPNKISLKVMQVIALEAPGSERLKRIAVAVDEDALREYGRAVEHFLFPPKSPGKHATGEPERSLSDKEPNTIGPPFHFHAGKGANGIQACCVDAPRTGEVEAIVRTREGILLSPSFANWDHVKNGRHQENEPQATWKDWTEAFDACIAREHWTGWITVGTQVRVHGQLQPQELIASAYLYGHGNLPNESDQWRIARRVQKLLIQQLVDAHEEQIIRQSRAAAISQVLARTLSHNLGSHSLNAFSGESAMLGQFQEIECRKRHKVPMPGRVCEKKPETDGTQIATDEDQLPPDESCIAVFKKYEPCNPQEEGKISQQRREWMATYNNYLRERMDLLADITTAVPAFEMPKQLVADLLKGYERNILLATTIAGTGGCFRYCWQPAGLIGEGKDVNVAISSDILGAHAFYLILENIVRNSAKHGGHSEEVVFTVKVTEPTEPEWKKKGLLCVQITEDLTDLQKNTKLVNDRNASINAPVLDDKTRRVRDNGWGTLEMKAACAYLRRIALEELDEKKYQAPVPKEEDEAMRAKEAAEGDEPPLLRAIGDPSQNKDFGYEFYLMRPKLVMVCADDSTEEAVTQTASLSPKGTDSLQDHGIGAMTLDELVAITQGERKEVVNHAMLVYLTKEEADLKRFVRAALMDLAALPHEMVVVGCEKCDVGTFKTLLEATTSELKGYKNSQLSPVAIEHNASILERSVVWMDRPKWEGLSNEPAKLYMEVRHRWLVGWMQESTYGIDSIMEAELGGYLIRLDDDSNADNNSVRNTVQYGPHDPMDVPLRSEDWMGLSEGDDWRDHTKVERRLVERYDNKFRMVIQSFPKAIDRIMRPAMSMPRPPNDELLAWAQHHTVSWFQGIAVIDERIQFHATTDAYQPEAKKDSRPPAVPINVLLAMGGVFTPPATLDLQRTDFDKDLWAGLLAWVRTLRPMLGYVCIHLTLLEKFEDLMENGTTVNDLLDEMRAALPGIRFIVVSGRGKPPELPKTELFMSYSALSQYTTQTYHRAPVMLNILAHNTRRTIQAKP